MRAYVIQGPDGYVKGKESDVPLHWAAFFNTRRLAKWWISYYWPTRSDLTVVAVDIKRVPGQRRRYRRKDGV